MKNIQRFCNAAETVVLEVDKEGFSAYLTIAETEEFINEKEILTLLNLAGIKHGIERAEAKRAEDGVIKEACKPFLIALAENPHPKISIQFHMQGANLLPAILKDLDSLESVPFVQDQEHIGSVIVEKFPDGVYTIFGEEIDVSDVTKKELKTLLGKNISYDETTGELFASAAGYLSKSEDGVIFVQDVVTVGESVRNAKVSCKTDLHIMGNVTGVCFKVDGSLAVDGLVENCGGEGLLALGDITVYNVENSIILAGGTITIKGIIIESKFIAEKSIIGNRDSAFCGGYISCGGDVLIGVLGWEESDTDVEIAVKPFIKEYFRRYNIPVSDYFIELYRASLSDIMTGEKITPSINITACISGGCRIRKLEKITSYLPSQSPLIL